MGPHAVALLTNFVPPYLVPFFHALHERVHQLRIWVSTPMEANRPWAFQGEGLPVRVQRTLTLPRTWRHPHGFSERLSLQLPLDTLRCLSRQRPEVIVSTELGLRTLQALIYRTLHPGTGLVLWALVSEATERGRSALRGALRRWMLRRVDAVVVSGESGARYVAGLGAPEGAIFRMPYTAPTGPDVPPARRAERESRRLLYVGQLIERKGLAAFLATLAGWAGSHPEDAIELWIAGDGPARSALAERRLPQNLRVAFLGQRSYADLGPLYDAAGILVFPTLADEWGVVVNEALEAGLPVLGSAYSQAVEELVEEGETGWTFRPDADDEMRAALERALALPYEERERMRPRCRERVRRVTPARAAERMGEAIAWAAAAAERRTTSVARPPGGAAAPAPESPACPLCHGSARPRHRLGHGTLWACTAPDCGLRFTAPQLDDAALGDAYHALYYPDAGAAAAVCEDTPEAVLRELVRVLGERRRDARALRLLDVGCGRGALLRIAREAGLAATGIEPDPRARAVAARTGASVYASAAELLDAEPDARFDVLALWQVVEHLRRPWEDLERLAKRLAPDGVAVIATPNAGGLKARLLGARWENVANPTHLYAFTERSLRRLLAAVGLARVERLSLGGDHPHHGPLRRRLQRVLRARGLDGDLRLVAQPGAAGGSGRGAAR